MPRPFLISVVNILAIQLALSLGFIIYFSRTFESDPWLPALHMTVVLFWHIGWLAITAPLFLFRRFSDKAYRAAVAVFLAIGSVLLAMVYAANFLSNLWWGSNVTYRLALDFMTFEDVVSLPYWVVAILVITVVAVIAIFFNVSKDVHVGLIELGHSMRTRVLFTTLVIASVVGVYLAFFYSIYSRVESNELLASDPLLSFFRKDLTVVDAFDESEIAAINERENAMRSEYASIRDFDRKNVVLIIADSLRADHTTVYGYPRSTTPFLESLMRSGQARRVEYATSTCAESNCGILSTLSSKRLRQQRPESFKLHDVLGLVGYKTYFVLSGGHDWYGLKESYGHDMDLYFDGTDSVRYPRADDRVLFEGLEKVPPYTGGSPAFFYFHLMSTHFMGTKLSENEMFQPSAVKNDWAALFRGENDQAAVINNYDNGVRQADATIGRLFQELTNKGYLENSIVIILADHGEALADRGERQFGHVLSLYHEFTRIPLLIYDPNGTGKYKNLEYAAQVDIAPTIVSLLFLPIPDTWQVHSLLEPARPEGYSFHQTQLKNPVYAIVLRSGGSMYKYIYRKASKIEELYDLSNDPTETLDIMPTADPSLINKLRQLMSVEASIPRPVSN